MLDGTLVRTDRVRMTARGADAPFYSGKAHHHRMNVQVIAGLLGESLWASTALPGASHDIACARAHGLPEALEAVTAFGTRVLADRGYVGIGHGIRVPIMALGRTETGAFREREGSQRRPRQCAPTANAPTRN